MTRPFTSANTNRLAFNKQIKHVKHPTCYNDKNVTDPGDRLFSPVSHYKFSQTKSTFNIQKENKYMKKVESMRNTEKIELRKSNG